MFVYVLWIKLKERVGSLLAGQIRSKRVLLSPSPFGGVPMLGPRNDLGPPEYMKVGAISRSLGWNKARKFSFKGWRKTREKRK